MTMVTTQTQLHKQNKKSTSQQQAISVMASAATSTEQVSEKQKNKKQRGTQQSHSSRVWEWEGSRDHRTQNKGHSWDNKQHTGLLILERLDWQQEWFNSSKWLQWPWCHCYYLSWQWETKQKINKSTANNFSDDKCNSKYRTSEWVTKTNNKKQKTKRHTAVTQ